MLVKINEYEWINPLNVERIQLLDLGYQYELIIRFVNGKVLSYEFKDKKEAEKIIEAINKKNFSVFLENLYDYWR